MLLFVFCEAAVESEPNLVKPETSRTVNLPLMVMSVLRWNRVEPVFLGVLLAKVVHRHLNLRYTGNLRKNCRKKYDNKNYL